LSTGQITDYVPHKRQDLKNAGNDREQRRSQSEGEINSQEERREINGSERKTFAREQVLHVLGETPKERKGGNDE